MTFTTKNGGVVALDKREVDMLANVQTLLRNLAKLDNTPDAATALDAIAGVLRRVGEDRTWDCGEAGKGATDA